LQGDALKDFANSWEQHSWESAVKNHAMYTEWLTRFTWHEGTLEYAKKRIAELEEKYPQLKEK
jgi:hypothetical protein